VLVEAFQAVLSELHSISTIREREERERGESYLSLPPSLPPSLSFSLSFSLSLWRERRETHRERRELRERETDRQTEREKERERESPLYLFSSLFVLSHSLRERA